MVVSSKQLKSTPGASGPLVLSLPCFKPIAIDSILNQSQTTTANTASLSGCSIPASQMKTEAIATVSKTTDEEKENTTPSEPSTKDVSAVKKVDECRLANSTNRDYLINEMSSSEAVPIVRLMGIEKQHQTTTQPLSQLPSIPPEKTQQVITTNFVFSPIAGRNSFLSHTGSFSASKAESSKLI